MQFSSLSLYQKENRYFQNQIFHSYLFPKSDLNTNIPKQSPTDYNLRGTVLSRVNQPISLICVVIAIPVIDNLELPPAQIRRRIVPWTINILPLRRVTPLLPCEVKETFLLQKRRIITLQLVIRSGVIVRVDRVRPHARQNADVIHLFVERKEGVQVVEIQGCQQSFVPERLRVLFPLDKGQELELLLPGQVEIDLPGYKLDIGLQKGIK